MMDALVSSEWPLLNQDFDEGSILADYDCEDFTALTNPACSPTSENSNNPDDILNDAWKEAFAKLKNLERDQHEDETNRTLTLGDGLLDTDTDDFQFDFSNTECDEDELVDPCNDCPCCDSKFIYRYQLISHLEKIHNRCAKCEYKFESADDLRLHQQLNVCGDDCYVEDDVLSISGDEDTSTILEDTEEPPPTPVKEKINVNTRLSESANTAFQFEKEDNKDRVWEEIRAMEERMRIRDFGGSFPSNFTRQLNDVAKKNGVPPPILHIKTEPDANNPSFEFESSNKSPPLKIKPNSLLKKRLRPNLATKVRGRYGKASLRSHQPPNYRTSSESERDVPKEVVESIPEKEGSEVTARTENRVEDEMVVVNTPPVAVKVEAMDEQPDPVVVEEQTCEICDMTFEGGLEMEEHSATHFKDLNKPVHCVVCELYLPNMAALNSHEKEKHSLFAYKCGECAKIFNTQSNFKEHERYHAGYKQCDTCGKKFLNEERLQRHKDYRCKGSDHHCTLCDERFSSNVQLEEHNSAAHGKTLYKCDKCNKSFDHKQTLAVHKMSHAGGDKPFKCKVCGKGFKTYWYYVVHEKCYCKHIDKKAKSQPTHASIEASKKKFYQCKICHRVFPHISHLKVHNYIHTGERPYKCNSCGKGFTQKQNLKVHERVHTGEKPYVCNSCGFGFKDLGNLRRHQYVHTGEKPHGCDVCGKRFTWIESLRRHKRTHQKQRPYQCKVCRREFVHHGHLRIHELVHKQDEKPFQCNICGKTFTMLSSLSIHEHIHLDRKPYPCDMCQRTFMTNSALSTHKQSHVQRMANAYRQAYRDKFSF